MLVVERVEGGVGGGARAATESQTLPGGGG